MDAKKVHDSTIVEFFQNETLTGVRTGLFRTPAPTRTNSSTARPIPGQPPEELLPQRLAPRTPDRLRESQLAEGRRARLSGQPCRDSNRTPVAALARVSD